MAEVEMMRPLGSLKVLAPESRSLYLLFDVLIRTAVRRGINTEITIELMTGTAERHLRLEFTPSLSRAEYFDLLRQAEPSLFSRGKLVYVESDSSVLLAQVSVIQTGNPHSDRLPIIQAAPHRHFTTGSLVVEGLTAEDVIFWPSITSEQIRRSTVLGNRHGPHVRVHLRHVGADRVVDARWEGQLFLEACGGKASLVLKPPWVESVQLGTGCEVEVACILAFNGAPSRFRISDSSRVYTSLEREVARATERALSKELSLRLRNEHSVYFDVFLAVGFEVGPLGELPPHTLRLISDVLPIVFSRLYASPNFSSLIEQAEKASVEREERRMRLRKERARSCRRVYIAEGGKKVFLYREPRNEQDVVILMCLLAQRGIFPVFEFLDYESQRGIDALARIKLTPARALDEDAIVEFKHRLEGFLDERHPLSLVDVIIAWDVSENRFKGSDFILTAKIEGRQWLGRLEDKSTGHMADVVILRHLPNLSVSKM